MEQQLPSSQLVEQLSSITGEHTSLVTLLIPSTTKDITSYSQMINSELTTASNVKNRQNRNQIVQSLKSIQEELKHYRSVPENGLALFASSALLSLNNQSCV